MPRRLQTHRTMARHKPYRSHPWSKLESRIRDLIAPDVDLRIRCTVYTVTTKHFTFDSPRHWITLGQEVIWDFPGDFLVSNHPNVPRPVEFLDAEYWTTGGSTISKLLREYLDCPVRELLTRSFDDPWQLCDILRAADRRIGSRRRREWGSMLPISSPARRVLEAGLP
jgi:hypothetical protein